jgi:hypothetical protein
MMWVFVVRELVFCEGSRNEVERSGPQCYETPPGHQPGASREGSIIINPNFLRDTIHCPLGEDIPEQEFPSK